MNYNAVILSFNIKTVRSLGKSKGLQHIYITGMKQERAPSVVGSIVMVDVLHTMRDLKTTQMNM